ncbi:hypothetical protein [Xenorhabdus cabanillasii]|uniref:Uncharacterized protein n=1 Tax=Xenorhabdus cabanillasii JM26 TaxID=1427517 RepID=W1INL3_9GAMM|nr:hypothetical protein [Xenorhabdus cabanillasii]CDL79231.1 hypothetical protein XCR1_1070008 [Xenorhabdus cabanillasii JM26]
MKTVVNKKIWSGLFSESLFTVFLIGNFNAYISSVDVVALQEHSGENPCQLGQYAGSIIDGRA